MLGLVRCKNGHGRKSGGCAENGDSSTASSGIKINKNMLETNKLMNKSINQSRNKYIYK